MVFGFLGYCRGDRRLEATAMIVVGLVVGRVIGALLLVLTGRGQGPR